MDEIIGLEDFKEASKDFEDATNKLFYVLMKPRGLRQRLLRWLYPELVKVADTLRKCYWTAQK